MKEYITDDQLTDAVADAVAKLPALASALDEVSVRACFAVQLDKNEEYVVGKKPVQLRRLPPEITLFTSPATHFVLVVDRGYWEHHGDKKVMPFIDQALARIKVERTDEGLKLGIRPWDVQTMVHTVRQYGTFDASIESIYDALSAKQLRMTAAAMQNHETVNPDPQELDTPEPAPVNLSPEEARGSRRSKRTRTEN